MCMCVSVCMCMCVYICVCVCVCVCVYTYVCVCVVCILIQYIHTVHTPIHIHVGETIDKKYSCSKSSYVRDATAKAIYQRMFRYIIHHINIVLEPPQREDYLHIGEQTTLFVCVFVCIYFYCLNWMC